MASRCFSLMVGKVKVRSRTALLSARSATVSTPSSSFGTLSTLSRSTMRRALVATHFTPPQPLGSSPASGLASASASLPLAVQMVQSHSGRRMLSTDATQGDLPTVDYEKAKAILNTLQMYMDIGHPAKALEQINSGKVTAEMSLIDRWQGMLHILNHTTLQVISPFGYSPDEKGLHTFNSQFADLMGREGSEAEELREASQKMWRKMLVRAFGIEIDTDKRLTLERAREFTSDVSAKLQSNDFKETLKEAMDDLGSGASNDEKRKELLSVLLPAQMEVMATYGYEGEDGYVEMQVALMEFAQDNQIKHNILAATFSAFETAGVPLQD